MSTTARFEHAPGVIEAHAVHGARAAVVPGREEFVVAEVAHDLDLVLRHGAERVVDVVLAAVLRPDAVAVAAEIRGHDVEALGEAGRHPVPRDVRHRVAVQQQERRPAAAMAQVDARAGRVDVEGLKILEHERAPLNRRRSIRGRWAIVWKDRPYDARLRSDNDPQFSGISSVR